MISTRRLSLLPEVEGLRRTLQAMAMLDAILCPEWQYRYYSFDVHWAPGEQMGSMRNGSGDHLFAHFNSAGCWIKGFAHESPMSPYREDPPRPWPEVLDAVPEEFAGCLGEPAFRIEDVTFCVWRRHTDTVWQMGPVEFPLGHPDPDGSEFLLTALDGHPESYRNWASDYYEREVYLDAVARVYRHEPLSDGMVSYLDLNINPVDLLADVNAIGYPKSQAYDY